MIGPITPGTFTRPQAAFQAPQASPDTVELSLTGSAPTPRMPRMMWLKTAVHTTVIAAILTPAALGGLPLMAQQQGETLRTGAAQMEKDLKQAMQIQVQAKPLDARGEQLLARLPTEMQAEYRGLDPRVKLFIADKLQGSSGILFIRINHRKAFIKGEAMGRDVFEFIGGRVDEKVRKGEMKPDTGQRVHKFLEVVSRLSVQQRQVLVELLEHDTGIKRK